MQERRWHLPQRHSTGKRNANGCAHLLLPEDSLANDFLPMDSARAISYLLTVRRVSCRGHQWGQGNVGAWGEAAWDPAQAGRPAGRPAGGCTLHRVKGNNAISRQCPSCTPPSSKPMPEGRHSRLRCPPDHPVP